MRSYKRNRSTSSQVVLGVLVIAMGVLFLLDNLHIIDFAHAISFWPVVFIVGGLVKLFDTGSRNNYLTGGLLVAVGVGMICNRLGLFYVSWHTLWPLLLIALGVMFLFRAAEVRTHVGVTTLKSGQEPKAEALSDSVVDVNAILAGFERNVTSQDFRGGEVTAILGGCVLDMRGASIQGEAVLNVFSLMGGITIKCPPDWSVVLHGTPILGGLDERTVRPPNESKRLIVTGHVILGGVEVRN